MILSIAFDVWLQAAQTRRRLALLIFLTSWLSGCPMAVRAFLQLPSGISILANYVR